MREIVSDLIWHNFILYVYKYCFGIAIGFGGLTFFCIAIIT